MNALPDYLSAYDPAWPRGFAAIRAHLRTGIDAAVDIEHVGSTAIPGMIAKPIIDIDILVHPERMPAMIAAIARLGYRHQGDLGIAGREAFAVEPGGAAAALPAHHLYACVIGGAELEKHLLFRDYLRAHPQEAAWLSQRKLHLGSVLALDRATYIARKSPDVERIMGAARAWACRR